MNAAGILGSVETHHSGADVNAAGVLGALPSGAHGRPGCAAIGQGRRGGGVRVGCAGIRRSSFIELEHDVTPWHDRLEKRYRRNGRNVNK